MERPHDPAPAEEGCVVSCIVYLGLGLGNVHRAHQAVYTQGANAGGRSEHRITAVSFRNRDLVAALRAQHGRHTVVEVGAGAAPPLALDVIDEVVLAAQVIRSMNVPNAPCAVQCSEPTIQVKE